jgi:hypothetical protein
MRRSILLVFAPSAAFVFFLASPDVRLFSCLFRNRRIPLFQI